jgi:hypothetical protein
MAYVPKVLTPENAPDLYGRLAKYGQVQDTSEIFNNGLVLGLLGRGGSGKTTTAGMIVHSKHAGHVLHVNMHGRPAAIQHIPGITSITPATWRDVKGIREDVESGNIDLHDDTGAGTVILDTWTEAQNIDLRGINRSGKIEIQEWGESQGHIMGETRSWVDIAERLGINIIFNLWEEQDEDKDVQLTRRHVSFARKLAAQWPGLVTFIGLIDPVENHPEYRYIDFRPSKRTDAKFGVAPTDNAKKIPYEMYYSVDQPLLADMLDVIKGDKEWPTSAYAERKRGSS